MAYPTDNAIQLINDYVTTSVSGGFSNDDIYLVNRLNDPYFSGNPALQGSVYTNFSAPSIFNVLSPSSIRNIVNSPGTAVAVIPLLNTTPHKAVDVGLSTVWATAYYLSNIITVSEFISITGIINQQIPDPAYISGISWSQLYIGRPIDLNDIESSR